MNTDEHDVKYIL